MSVFVIADLHLDTKTNLKSMEVFGQRWLGYVEKLKKNWTKVVDEADTVIIPGDISWALNLEDAIEDLKFIDALPGKKIIMKGNHDFWWSTVSKINKIFEENKISTISLLNNNALELDDFIVAGSRGWFTDKSMQNVTQGDVDYQKIVNRETIRLKMSLDAAQKLKNVSGKEIFVFLHFPPVWGDFCCESIVELLKAYDVKRCYFGHIHGSYSVKGTFLHEDIRFQMISADFLDFLPNII